jgi:chromate transport protein ChrA
LGVGNVFNPVPFQFTLNCEETGLIAVKLAVEIGKKLRRLKMGLTEIVAGILMSGIMLAVVILLLKLIKDTRATMKIQNKSED